MTEKVLPAMFFLTLFSSFFYCAKAQRVEFGRPPILVLKTGTAEWPIKLTKEWFEGDTAYTLTFRDANYKSFKQAQMGFFKFELKLLGRAFQKSLTIDSTLGVEFDKGIMTATMNAGKKRIEWVFSNSSVIFRANESDVKKIIDAIAKE